MSEPIEEMEAINMEPQYPSSIVWKSKHIKEEEQFERMKKMVSHVAPQQVQGPWNKNKGGHQQSFDILPQTFPQYIQHRIDVLESKIVEEKKNIALKKANMKHKNKVIVAAFDGKKLGFMPQYSSWLGEGHKEEWPSHEAFKAKRSRELPLAVYSGGWYGLVEADRTNVAIDIDQAIQMVGEGVMREI